MEQPRLLAVHAHADDETITMGGTMALCADRGARVVNVCCTDGSLATIVDPEMAAREEEVRPRLAEIRREELTRACRVLGVEEVHWLGYRDSGMAGASTNSDAGAFWRADLDEVTGRLVAIIRDVRPHVVVTYDANGAYGHPDHVQAHRATLLAVEAARVVERYPDAGAPWTVSKIYYTAFPRSEAERIVALAQAAGLPPPFGDTPVDELGFIADDAVVTTGVDVRTTIPRKLAALREHRSQIGPDFPMLLAPEEVMVREFSVEHFSLALTRGAGGARETDLFAGVAV
jgi:N-acetyl-1-D-myo-inositol-2-amino-2-deoxy-alpha-D-glucopyranoside deacetylase